MRHDARQRPQDEGLIEDRPGGRHTRRRRVVIDRPDLDRERLVVLLADGIDELLDDLLEDPDHPGLVGVSRTVAAELVVGVELRSQAEGAIEGATRALLSAVMVADARIRPELHGIVRVDGAACERAPAGREPCPAELLWIERLVQRHPGLLVRGAQAGGRVGAA